MGRNGKTHAERCEELKDKIYSMYWDDEKSLHQISKDLDVNKDTLSKKWREWDYELADDRTYQTGPKTEAGKMASSQNLPSTNDLKDVDTWNYSNQGIDSLKQAMKLISTKHGLYASIPILCKQKECPYKNQCPLAKKGNYPEFGEPCPVEVATIRQLGENYMDEMDITENDTVDIGAIRDLVDIDISIMRANKKLAIDADIVKDVVVGMADDGTSYTQPQLNKGYELKDRLLAKKSRILRDLNSTREAKAKDERAKSSDPSSIISEMKGRLKKYKEQENNTIDITEEEKAKQEKEKQEEE